MQFTLSVIIPVYNGERFIEKAIKSVVAQEEVTEIIVVNDGSSDRTEDILVQLQKQVSILNLYHHSNQSNLGRSASRNLGIQKATGNYIAFLDADDYFSPNRFINDKQHFQENEICDGVYNAIGVHFYRPSTIKEQQEHKLYTVRKNTPPELLFEYLLSGKRGHFSIVGLTVKKSVFDTVGLFNTNLVVSEDTEVFLKMAIKCRLETGVIDRPLSIRGVHDDNVFNQVALYEKYRIVKYRSLVVWCSKNQAPYHIIDDLLKRIWMLKHKENNNLFQDTFYWAKLFLPNPRILFSILSIKYFPLIRFRKMLFPFLYRKVES
jgi:glycosyltransferase involved in cell wall biosynthesis